MIDCNEVESTLYQYLDKELDEKAAKEFADHIELCRLCFDHVKFEGLLKDHMRKKTEHICPASVKSRIKNIIDRF